MTEATACAVAALPIRRRRRAGNADAVRPLPPPVIADEGLSFKVPVILRVKSRK
jgi:hypothetical protein